MTELKTWNKQGHEDGMIAIGPALGLHLPATSNSVFATTAKRLSGIFTVSSRLFLET